MTTLITGAGLVGTSFAQHAVRRGEDVVFYDPMPRDEFLKIKLGSAKYKVVKKDLRDLPGLIQAIQDHKVSTVVHSAGLIGKRNEDAVYLSFNINVVGTVNVAEAARLTGVQRIVHVSTVGVYDYRRSGTEPIVETAERGSGEVYGNFKTCNELALEAYSRLYGVELIIIRPAGAYGLGHFWAGSGGGEKMQIMVEGGLRGQVGRVRRSQANANEYIYCKDLGGLIDRATTVPMPTQTFFNGGTGVLTTFEELVDTVKRVVPDLKVEFIEDGKPKSRSRCMDISAARKHLGWTPSYSLEEGFRDYVADIKSLGLDNLGKLQR